GLPIAFEQRHIDRKSDARPRHHLPLEGIAVDVDDPGQDHKAAGVDHPLGARLRADADDDPGLAIEIDAGLLETAPDERATSFDAHAHDRSELRTSGLFGPIPRLTRLRPRRLRRASLPFFLPPPVVALSVGRDVPH